MRGGGKRFNQIDSGNKVPNRFACKAIDKFVRKPKLVKTLSISGHLSEKATENRKNEGEERAPKKTV